MKVLFIPRLSENVLQMARDLRPPDLDVTFIGKDASQEELISAIGEADALMGMLLQPHPLPVWQSMGHLKLVQVLSAGYDEVNLKVLRQLRVPLATNGGANAVAVAEHTIMLILAVYRHLTMLDARVKSGGWQSGPMGSLKYHELEGKTVGIVGLGMIGRQVAKRLRGFGTNTVYYDSFRPSAEVERDLDVQYMELNELLRRVDVLTLHVPVSAETTKLIGAEQLALMKPSAIFINASRGGLVDQDALYEALRDGRLWGAGLDTTEPEPPPADLPLLKLPNLTITPHTAGPTVESWPKRLRNAYANLQRVAAGDKPLWIVPEMRDLFD